ncbi:hypothetical protein [Actinocrinis sp.]|uniref:hypothetical protein n=1 Tax=Actinocrinis sp. TaxID=1920516 RepID=UPI002CB000A3|nr:hypothetical protein [Actinocrinis sp.]HXR69738.1 hypothetical protein [Actinocrinis sp.]
MDLTKLGRTERVLAIVGLLAFIDSFLPWYSVSFKGELGVIAGGSASANAWDTGFWAWFPMLLLFAIGVLVALPAVGQNISLRGGFAAIGAASLLATIIVLIRWLTYPSVSDAFGSAGADFGTYIGLILCVVATVFAYLAFTAAGGTLNNFAAAFKGPQPQEGVTPGGHYIPPGTTAPPGEQPPTWQQPPQI